MPTNDLPDGCEYIIRDASDALSDLDESPAAIFLDDAWARPQRAQQFGVEYDTHPFDESQEGLRDHIDTSITTTEIIDACFEALDEGGWLIADADDWLLPRLVRYIQEEWGDVAASYQGGGYRKIGGVTYLSSDGEPDKSTAGMYLSTGGYPVIFAHKGETDRRTSVSARQIADRPHNQYDWGSVKPITPYEEWISGLVAEDELIAVPCAGTAPAALAAERVHGDAARYICIDIEEEARTAFNERRSDVVTSHRQEKLG
jgi:hypothetical protein